MPFNTRFSTNSRFLFNGNLSLETQINVSKFPKIALISDKERDSEVRDEIGREDCSQRQISRCDYVWGKP